MSITNDQGEQPLHGALADGGEVDLDTLFQDHLIDWDNLDSVPFEELSNLAGLWNDPMVDMANEVPEAPRTTPCPTGPAAATSDREPDADKDSSQCLATLSPRVSVLPNFENDAVEEDSMPTGSLNDLDFSNFDFAFAFSGSSGNDPLIVEDIDGPTLPNDPNSSPRTPKELTPAVGPNCRYSETPSADLVEPSQIKSIRLAKRNPNFKVNINYTPLSTKPRPWHIFTYTEHGELTPECLFTAAEVRHYLWRHPLHEESHSPRSSALTLRIHRNPPASQDRYPANHGSHRCRFHECPADNNTIDKGQFIVMFDELSEIHPNHDPYLTAGYVHLYCLERFLDFPKICATLNVQTEKRRFDKETKNLMRLDPKQVEEEADGFIETCREARSRRPDGYPGYKERSDVTGKPYEGTLTHRMHLAKLTNRSSSINKQEAAREKAAGQKGGSLGSHLGDLVLATTLRQSTRKHKKQNQLVANPQQKRKYKGDGVIDGGEDGSNDVEPSHCKGDERLKQLRRPSPPLVTSTAYMVPSTTRQLGGHRLLPTSGNHTSSLDSPYALYKLDENRKFIMPTENRLSPAPLLNPRQYCQREQHHQSSNAQTHANVPAPAPGAEHQQYTDPGISSQSKKRSSDEAGNDEAGHSLGGRVTKSFAQNSLDAGLRPVKKFKDSHTMVSLSLAQRQAHQRQVLLKQNKVQPLPPPPARPQATKVGHKRRANEAKVNNSSTQVSELARLSTLGPDIERGERKLENFKQTNGPPSRVPPQVSSPYGNQMQHAQSASKSPACVSGPYPAPPAAPSTVSFTGPPALQSQAQSQKLPLPIAHSKRIDNEIGHLLGQHPLPGHQQGFASAQHHLYDIQQGYHPTQRATHSYYPHDYPQQRPQQGLQTQQASNMPEARRLINEDYDRYTQQNGTPKAPKNQKPRKRSAEVLGNGGKVIKNKQSMVTRTREMRFGGLGQKKLMQEQQKLFADAELRADEERAARQMEAIEQEEAKLRAEDEHFARQRELNKRDGWEG